MNSFSDPSTALRQVREAGLKLVGGPPVPIIGVRGQVGYICHDNSGGTHIVGSCRTFADGVTETHAILFRVAAGYEHGEVVLICNGEPYRFTPALYEESGAPWGTIKLSLRAGVPI